jgi:uncharacterized protein
MRLGDARVGKLAQNIVGFGRTLRRAGLPIDASRIALAQEALIHLKVLPRADVKAAMETVFVTEQGQRALFSELFDEYFKDPALANKLLAQMLPQGAGKAEPANRRTRVQEALTAKQTPLSRVANESELKFDATMTASQMIKLQQADFNQLSQAEFNLVEKLAARINMQLPAYKTRRTVAARSGNIPNWPNFFRSVAQWGLDAPLTDFRRRRVQPCPLLVLVDISGSMERYSRMMLTFLHAATKPYKQRSVFTFGTKLTQLDTAFKRSDPDLMLREASRLIGDFAGGTRLGDALGQLRQSHARSFVGRRTIVLLVSDGLDTGDSGALANHLQWVKRHCGSLFWLNPLMRYDGFTPTASGPTLLHRHADKMLAIHNLSSLEQLAASFASLTAQTRIQH